APCSPRNCLRQPPTGRDVRLRSCHRLPREFERVRAMYWRQLSSLLRPTVPVAPLLRDYLHVRVVLPSFSENGTRPHELLREQSVPPPGNHQPPSILGRVHTSTNHDPYQRQLGTAG